MTPADESRYVSRGGLKLEHALNSFHIDAHGLRCADFGCSTGGFTDCLLQHGAASVIAIDTAYGQFAWKLRNDPRVTLLERTNALHVHPPGNPVDLIAIDLGWTPQRLAVPAALHWLAPLGRIVTLIKPHYELDEAEKRSLLHGGILGEADAERAARRVAAHLPIVGARVLGLTRSPILGGGSKRSGKGNPEWLALLARAE